MTQSALIKPAESVIAQNRSAQSGGSIMRFPKDIGAHAMILNFKDYEYAGGGVTNTLVGNSIVLPLPKNITDSYKVTIDEGKLGIIGAAIAEAATRGVDIDKLANADFSAISSDPAAAASFFVNSGLLAATGGAIGSVGGKVGALIGGVAGRAASQPVGTALSAASGTMVNPHATVMFTGIGLKTHQFDWTLSPKSKEESKTLKNIINEIRKATLPSYTSPVTGTGTALDRSLLRYPKMVDIFFVGLDQSYYYYFKTCMISQLNIDYSGQGNALYAGDNGARPVMVNLQIGLMESSIHTREDYEEGGSSSTLNMPSFNIPFVGPQ
jgi:hypothetical protein